MLSSRDAALRLGSRIISGYNILMLVAFVSGTLALGLIEQWFFSPATTTPTAQSSSTTAYHGNDLASVNSKNPILIAYALAKHMTPGYQGWLNGYNLNDPVLQPAITSWKQECNGTICLTALPPGFDYTRSNILTSCNPANVGCSTGLQCATFVHTVFELTDHPLPAGGNANEYWGEAPFNSGQASGWQEFYNGSKIPQPGDLAVWNNDPYGPYGHIAIVVDVTLPHNGSNGRVLLAQANGQGNITIDGANLLSASLLPDGLVTLWGWDIPTVNGFEFTGFIHNTSVSYQNLTSLLSSTGTVNRLGGYTLTGAPTITADQINAVLVNAHSPAAGTGQSLYDLGVQYRIDPVFALAFFMEESTFGTTGVATITHSLGNIRCMPPFTCYDGYTSYVSWQQGYQAWYQLISGPTYVGAGLTTVPQIIPRYAPSSDNNNEAQYIQNVEQAVQKWRDGDLTYV